VGKVVPSTKKVHIYDDEGDNVYEWYIVVNFEPHRERLLGSLSRKRVALICEDNVSHCCLDCFNEQS